MFDRMAKRRQIGNGCREISKVQRAHDVRARHGVGTSPRYANAGWEIMKTRSSILRRALVFAIASMATTASAQAVAPTPLWAILEPMGWTPLAFNADDTLSAYVRFPVVRPPGAFPRIWVRWEYSTPQTDRYPNYRSIMDLNEVNCSQGTTRIIQEQTYIGNNFEGEASSSLTGPTTWQYPGPGTFNESILRVVCGKQ
jgi:hypothetical protein